MGRILCYTSCIMGDLVQKNLERRQWAAAYTWVDYMKEIAPSVLDNDPALMVYYVHNEQTATETNDNRHIQSDR